MIKVIIDKDVRLKDGTTICTVRWYQDRAARDAALRRYDLQGLPTRSYVRQSTDGYHYGLTAQVPDYSTWLAS